MTFSISQRFRYFIIKIIINLIWALDVYSNLFFGKKSSKILSFSFVGLFTLFILSLFTFVGRKQLNLLYTGLNTTIYGYPVLTEQLPTISTQNVMGVKNFRSHTPILINKTAFPYITAKAHLIIDNNSQKILSEHNIDRAFAPASTTKLMTALVSLDIYSQDEQIQVLPECLEIDSTKIWLPVGQKFLVKDIINSLLIGSAGDCACVLANSKVSVDEFVKLMNGKAIEIGMKNTYFTNPIGLDGENGSHYSSASDLYLLSDQAMKDDFIRNAVSSKEYVFSPTGDEELKFNITNTNKLLWEIPGTVGVKTGRTSGAGEVLIYRYDKEGKNITIIVMSSEDRFLDTKNLLQWTLDSFSWN